MNSFPFSSFCSTYSILSSVFLPYFHTFPFPSTCPSIHCLFPFSSFRFLLSSHPIIFFAHYISLILLLSSCFLFLSYSSVFRFFLSLLSFSFLSYTFFTSLFCFHFILLSLDVALALLSSFFSSNLPTFIYFLISSRFSSFHLPFTPSNAPNLSQDFSPSSSSSSLSY